MGEFVTERFDYDGGRDVTAYVPRGPLESVVFTDDGQLTARWGAVLDASGVQSTLVVGVHRSPDEVVRLHEYSQDFDPDRFASHERFVLGDVRSWVKFRFAVSAPADRTAVFGVSAGAELALALGLRHPEVFGAILCASPGAGFRPPSPLPTPRPRTYLVAGTEEPFFRDNAARWAEALHQGTGDVVMEERVGSHGGTFWQDELPLMLAWAFKADPSRARSGRRRQLEQAAPRRASALAASLAGT